MPRRLRTWRFTFWAALIPTILLTLAAAANIFFAYGLTTPGGRFLCWCDGSISTGVNTAFDEFEFFGDVRPQVAVTDSGSSQWVYIRALADHHIDIPAWLAPLPTLGICVLAFKMTRTTPHPRCRKCRYDLRGLTPDANGRLICPECGSRAGSEA